MKKNALPLKNRITYSGISATAARLGCSREHLSRVLHSKRKANDTLRRRLNRMGITHTAEGQEI